MINFIKTKLGITTLEEENKYLRSELVRTQTKIDKQIHELDNLTRIDGDMGVRGPCTIILSGVWRGRGYVKFYEMDHREFQRTVKMYQDMRKHNVLRNIDTIPGYRGGSFEM